MGTLIAWLIALIVSYLLGSISSAILVCRLLRLPDPREQGSKNPGATNVLRFGGRKAAITILAFDILKGVVAVLFGKLLHLTGFSLATVALMATVGHMYPIFFGFKGGKGVATALGALLALSLWLGLATVAVWLLATLISRYVSLGSICAAASAPFISIITPGIMYTLPIAVMSLLIIYRHMDNIQRLRDGQEDKLTLKRNTR